MKRKNNKNSSIVLSCITVLIAFFAFSGCDNGSNNDPNETDSLNVQITIDKTKTFQEIWGFGATIGRSAEGVHEFDTLNVSVQDEILDFLFKNTDDNCGLTIASLTVKPFHNPSPGRYIWAEDAPTLTNAVTYGEKKQMEDTQLQLNFANEALKRNPDLRFKATVFSPPAYMKDPPNVNGGILATASYDDFVNWLGVWMDKYRGDKASGGYGYNIMWLSPQNEPDLSSQWHQAKYTAVQFDEMFYRLGTSLKNKYGADISLWPYLIGGPDTSGLSPANNFVNAMKNGTGRNSIDFLGYIATHNYNYNDLTTVDHITNYLPTMKTFGIPIFQAEACDGHNDHVTTMEDGIKWAEQMSIYLNNGAVAYLYWWFAAGHTTTNQMLVYFNQFTNLYDKAKRCYVFGQYSRYMRPGDIRVAADVTGLRRERFYATAVKDHITGKLSLVVTNRTEQDITATIKGFDATTLGGRRTSRTMDMTPLVQLNASDKVYTMTFPALSVTSLCEDNYIDN